jgi:hypothetical protein
MVTKFCPLKKQPGNSADAPNCNCLCDEDKCAWWFGAQECCSIPAIANCLLKPEVSNEQR